MQKCATKIVQKRAKIAKIAKKTNKNCKSSAKIPLASNYNDKALLYATDYNLQRTNHTVQYYNEVY